MNLTNAEFGWFVAMDEGRIQRIEVDFRLGLLIADKSDTASLHIETSCYLKCEGRDMPLTPDEPSSLAPALALFNAQVADVTIQQTGRLIVTFRDGRSLEVDPHEMYEAWQFGCTNSFLLVCSPGGGVSVFRQPHVIDEKGEPSERH